MSHKYLASGKFYRNLFIILLPILLQFFIQNFINFLDNLMVGQLGENEIAAVSVANQYYKIFYPTVVSICTGAAIFTAQYFGSKKYENLQKMFGIKLILPFIVTILFVVIGFRFDDVIIRHFISDNELAVQYGKEYLRIALWSYLPLSLSTTFTFTFRPLNKSSIPMVASSVGLITNTILNYFLIYGNWIFPHLGVKGAAIGTVVARCLELAIYLFVFFKNDYPFKARLSTYLQIDWRLFRHTMKKVFPLFLNEMTYSIAVVTIFTIYCHTGDSVVSINVVNISDVITQIVFILASGLGTATSILVGHKLGDNKLEEAEQNANYLLGYGLMMGILIMILISSIAFLVPQFYRISDTTKHLTSIAILIQGGVAPILMLTRMPFFILRSGGRVWEVLLLDSVFMWVVKVPVAILLSKLFQISIIELFLAVELTRILNAMISLWFYNKKKWLKNLT